MRVNLKCPYDEKEEAKALGAKWDSENKTWYVIYPDDLKLFSKWLPVMGARFIEKKKNKDWHKPVITGKYRPSCACIVLPWEECEHTEEMANKAMLEMLDLPF